MERLWHCTSLLSSLDIKCAFMGSSRLWDTAFSTSGFLFRATLNAEDQWAPTANLGGLDSYALRRLLFLQVVTGGLSLLLFDMTLTRATVGW